MKNVGAVLFSVLQRGGPICGEGQGRGVGFPDGEGKEPPFVSAAYIGSGHAGPGTPSKKLPGLTHNEIRPLGVVFRGSEPRIHRVIK